MAAVNCLVTNILQNTFFCVQQKKETPTGLENEWKKNWQATFWRPLDYEAGAFKVSTGSDDYIINGTTGKNCWQGQHPVLFLKILGYRKKEDHENLNTLIILSLW